MIRNSKAFTIIELMVSIVIIGIISSCMVVVFHVSSNAQKRTTNNLIVLNEISNLYNIYSSDVDFVTFVESRYPDAYVYEASVLTIYYDSQMKPTSSRTGDLFRIQCTLSSSSGLETIHIDVLFPGNTEAQHPVTDRTIRKGAQI
jgi:prepilin-type N-terminal cleavage/methylation domain-containing protein